jgi:beta-glucanase (GH16 family)
MRYKIVRGLKSWVPGLVVCVALCLGVWESVWYGPGVHRTVFAEALKENSVARPRAHAITAQPVSSSDKSSRADEGTWALVWSDEFNQQDGSAPDSTKWSYDEGVGNNGWGNSELEYYTSRAKNVSIQNGNLVITAIRESYVDSSGVTRDFTSARIKTRDRFAQAYGRFEARIKIPGGVGLWPAFWMLGDNIKLVGWPSCGEIDIMENIGPEPTKVHGTIHGPAYSAAKGISSPYALAGGRRFADDYHVFAVEWEPNAIRFYVDNDLYATRTPADLPSGAQWVYDHPFFIILNLAVGGNWPGPPDATTSFAASMLVDYVRVYQRSNAQPASK